MKKKIKRISIITTIILGTILVAFALFYFHYIYPSQTHEIILTENGFEPTSITINRFDIVKFSTTAGKTFWPASNLHPLHDIYPAFDPKMPIDPSKSWSFRFTKVGTWEFHDHLFPAYRGNITVVVTPSRIDYSLQDIPALKLDIKEAIAKKGAAVTYREVKDAFANSLSTESHLAAHIFGEVLYGALGTEGIGICDDAFGFGCYHALFGQAVANEGSGIVKELDRVCVEKFGHVGLGCTHGIGHGLGEYMGPERIVEQLQVCSELTWQGDLFGCSGGVFMENNFPTQIGESSVTIELRKLEGEDYYAPCDSIPNRYRKSCIFEQTSWWIEVLNRDYEKIAQLCLEVGNPEAEYCLRGLGNHIVERSAYNIDITKDLCKRMPDKTSEALCRAGAHWAFFSNPEKRSQANDLCQDLGSLKEFCIGKADLLNFNENTL